MPIDILEEQIYSLERKLEDAKQEVSELEDQALMGNAKPTFKEMFNAKREVKLLEKSLLKVQHQLEQAYAARERGGMKY